MLLPETIHTPRLCLRKPLIEDAHSIYESYGCDPEVTRFLTWRPHRSVGDAFTAMLSRLACWENGSEFSWSITPANEPATVMGMISAVPDVKPWRCALGYVIAQRYWNQGFMTEAVRTLISTLFAQQGICRVWAIVDEENFASARVLEKAGMEREGILHRWSLHPNVSSLPRDCWCFASVR